MPELKIYTERQSNMELLRIVAMFLIVLFHVCMYVLIKYESQYPIIKPLYTLSHIGVILFILISGYFGIKPSIKGLANIYFFMLFYNILLFIGWVVIGGNEFSKTDLIKLFLPFSHSAPWLWFMKTYVLLYLLSPLLNKARDFKPVDCKMMLGSNILIIICLGIILFWFGWINRNSDLHDGRNIIEFSFLYLLGAFFKDRVIVREDNRLRLRKVFLWSYVGLSLLVGVVLYFATGRVLDVVRWICHPYCSPVLIALASLFFLFFMTLSFQSRIVNRVAVSVLAVYLVHENKYFDFIPWYKFIESHFLQDSRFQFVAVLFAGIVIIMLSSICIDQLRIVIKRLIFKI